MGHKVPKGLFASILLLAPASLIMCVFGLTSTRADDSGVTIEPRTPPAPGITGGAGQLAPNIRIDADLVLVPVLVTDRNDRLITGLSLAGVSSRTSLDRALELVGYETFRTQQAAARSEGRYLGVGFATFIEASPGPTELRRGAGPFSSERAKVSLQPAVTWW